MAKDVANFVQSCPVCAKVKGYPSGKRVPSEVVVSDRVMDLVAMDFLGPLKVTKRGYRHVLVIMDHLSRFTVLVPTRDVSSDSAARALFVRWICVVGTPARLLSDQGACFMSETIAAICTIFGIEKLHTSAMHPQTNGKVERFNRTLVDMLIPYLNKHQDNWDDLLPFLMMAYNSAVHTETKLCPHFVMLGRDPVLPVDIMFRTRMVSNLPAVTRMMENMQQAQEQIRSTFVEHRQDVDLQKIALGKTLSFHVGELVMLHNSNTRGKLDTDWEGPFEVVDVLSPQNYRIVRVESLESVVPLHRKDDQIVHACRLKRVARRARVPAHEE